MEERIIDPLKVVRTALVDAARICSSSPLNLSKGPLCKQSTMTKFLFPAFVIVVFTHDLWLDHYECYCQLFEDVYATCRRTTLLLVGFSAGRWQMQFQSEHWARAWICPEVAHHQDAWIDGVLVDQYHCLARPSGELMRTRLPQNSQFVKPVCCQTNLWGG